MSSISPPDSPTLRNISPLQSPSQNTSPSNRMRRSTQPKNPTRFGKIHQIQTRNINPIQSSFPDSPVSTPEINWMNLKRDYSHLEPLKMTLRGRSTDQLAIEASTYKKFSEKELAECEVLVNAEGKLCLGNPEQPINGKLIFVMVRKEDNIAFYAAEGIDGSVFHSSLSESPLVPGTFICKDGVPVLFNEESGHFAPNKRIAYAVAELAYRGCRISESVTVKSSRYRVIEDDERTPLSEEQRLRTLDQILSSKSATEEKGPLTPKSARISTPKSSQKPQFSPSSHPRVQFVRNLLIQEASNKTPSPPPPEDPDKKDSE